MNTKALTVATYTLIAISITRLVWYWHDNQVDTVSQWTLGLGVAALGLLQFLFVAYGIRNRLAVSGWLAILLGAGIHLMTIYTNANLIDTQQQAIHQASLKEDPLYQNLLKQTQQSDKVAGIGLELAQQDAKRGNYTGRSKDTLDTVADIVKSKQHNIQAINALRQRTDLLGFNTDKAALALAILIDIAAMGGLIIITASGPRVSIKVIDNATPALEGTTRVLQKMQREAESIGAKQSQQTAAKRPTPNASEDRIKTAYNAIISGKHGTSPVILRAISNDSETYPGISHNIVKAAAHKIITEGKGEIINNKLHLKTQETSA